MYFAGPFHPGPILQLVLASSVVTMRFRFELSYIPVPFYNAVRTLPWILWSLGMVLEAAAGDPV